MEGIARFHDMIAAHARDPRVVVIGIETDRGLFVAALLAAGYQGSAEFIGQVASSMT